MVVMAKARKQRSGAAKPIGPRGIMAQVKASPDFTEWFEGLLKHVRLPAPVAIEHALVAFAKAHGYDEPPPER
jgi:hypothetical protein